MKGGENILRLDLTGSQREARNDINTTRFDARLVYIFDHVFKEAEFSESILITQPTKRPSTPTPFLETR